MASNRRPSGNGLSGLNVQGTQVLAISVVIGAFMILKPVKEWFYTREEGIATERRVSSVERSVGDINASIKEMDQKNETRINVAKTELKNDMAESNRLILSRMSEVTDRLILKIDQNTQDFKERIGWTESNQRIEKVQKKK